MLLLESISLDSFLEKNSSVYTVCILLNQEDTFSMIVADSMAIGIQEGTHLAILSCSWKLTQIHLLFLTILTLLV